MKPIVSRAKWLDLVFKSDLSPVAKLTASVISETVVYSRHYKLSLSNISPFAISRTIKTNSAEVEAYLDELLESGYLFDTEARKGARRVYATTFSLLPRKFRK